MRGAVGNESKIHSNVGELLDEEHYKSLRLMDFKSSIVEEEKFDSGRNLKTFFDNFNNDKFNNIAIVSGRKPSGACHFGHRMVVDTLVFFQKNGSQIFMPIADLEASLDEKIKDESVYIPIAADNLLDWGACGLNLDVAHVYLQSEEKRVTNIAYSVARELTFEKAIDIYGRDTIFDEFPFLFAALTQVGDIILPQHRDFSKKHSTMIAGPDQDGHMKMTMFLSGNRIKSEDENITSMPSAIYVSHVPGLSEDKASASNPEHTIYLGSMRTSYAKSETGKKLETITRIGLEERINESLSKVESHILSDEDKTRKCIASMQKLFPELGKPGDVVDFKSKISEFMKNHMERRKCVLEYALAKAYTEMTDSGRESSKEKINTCIKNNGLSLDLEQLAVSNNYNKASIYSTICEDVVIESPSFWNVPKSAIVPEEKKSVKTKWYNLIAQVSDSVVV
ncbi:MAG: hypothetical protein PHW96_03880 [Candidatus Nanoarchaeia archaeon]|nr:hypothetical protein [Candidatus Nanoarchaeia archaeon]